MMFKRRKNTQLAQPLAEDAGKSFEQLVYENQLLTYKEAAEKYFKCSTKTIERMVKAGKIRSTNIGGNKIRLGEVQRAIRMLEGAA